MTDDTEVNRLRMVCETQGYDAAISELQAFSAAQIKVGESIKAAQTVASGATAAQTSYARAFDRQTALFDQVGKAQLQYAKQLGTLNGALQQGAITNQQYAERLILLEGHFKSIIARTNEHTNAAGLNRVQMMESIHVFKSLADSVIAGQNPMRALAVESGRIGQIFSEGNGSVGTQLKGLAAQVGELASAYGPAILGGSALTAVLVAGIVSWYDYVEAIEKAKVSVAGVGSFAGLTADQLVRLADRSANAGRISEGAARGLAGDYAATGRIGSEMIGQLIAVTKDYAATTGQAIPKAGEELAKAFADPAKGAEELNAKLGFLDDKTAHYIDTLEKQNNRAEAQKVLLAAMQPSLDDAATHVTSLGHAWDIVTTAARNAFDAMGAAIDRATREATTAEKIADLKARHASPTNRTTYYGDGAYVTDADQSDADYQAQLKALQDQLATEQKIAAEKAKQVEANRESLETGQRSRELTPGYDAYEKAKNDLAAQDKALNDPQARAGIENLEQAIEVRQRLANQIKSMTDANGHFISSEQNRIALMQKEADLARDRKDPAKARADAAEIDRLKLYGKPLTDSEIAGQTAAAGDRAYNRSEAGQRSGLPQLFTGFEKGTQDIQAQSQDYGLSPAVLAEQKAVNDLTAAVTREMEAKKQSGAISVDLVQKIQQEAAARAQAVAANERAKQSYTDLMNQEKFLSDQGFSLFEGAIKGSKAFSQSLIGVIEQLEKAVMQSILLGQGPLAGLFGTQAAVSGQVGGLFGGLFGNQTSAATPGIFSGISGLFAGLFADGGTIGSNQWGIVGERGPEIVKGAGYVQPLSKVPTTSSSTSSSGGMTNVVNHFYVQTPDAPSFARSEQQITGMLSRAVGRGARAS